MSPTKNILGLLPLKAYCSLRYVHTDMRFQLLGAKRIDNGAHYYAARRKFPFVRATSIEYLALQQLLLSLYFKQSTTRSVKKLQFYLAGCSILSMRVYACGCRRTFFSLFFGFSMLISCRKITVWTAGSSSTRSYAAGECVSAAVVGAFYLAAGSTNLSNLGWVLLTPLSPTTKIGQHLKSCPQWVLTLRLICALFLTACIVLEL